jgi:putative heme-binding domain-containing protein
MRRSTIAAVFLIALASPATAADAPDAGTPPPNSIAIEALSRLKDIDLEANPGVKAAVIRVIESTKGTAQFVELVREFRFKDQDDALLGYAMAHPGDSAAADALRQILANKNAALIGKALAGADALKVIEPLGNTGDHQITGLLEPIVIDKARDIAVRQRAVRALAQVQTGAAALLKLAREGRLPDDLKLTAGAELNAVRWPEIKAGAAELLPPPQSLNSEPLPPISDLMKRKGDPAHGVELFFSPQVGCGNCHQVNGKGIDFGPKLSEIGTKLGKDGLYAAILDPNAGISFGFETWQILLKDGDDAYGLLASETADEITIKAAGGIVTRYKKNDIARRDQLKTSTMPSGLQQTMTVQGLVDLVEYLSSLKKASN